MATEKLQIVLDADWRGGSAVRRADQEIGGLTEKATRNWGNVVKGIGAATLAIGAVGVAAGQAYKMVGEGADLLRAEDQFGRLAESIDSTADSLMGRLRDATRGMVSDAELVQSATQIMSLGLQDTEDGVTRLAAVSGQLGWDMNQVILTMANNSTMRLDALGLSIEDVQTKMKALEEQGYSTDKAFDLAVIEAGEEKVKLLGNSAETTAGALQIFETGIKNAQDEFKVELVRGMAEGIAEMGGSAQDAAADIAVLAGAWGRFWGVTGGAAVAAAAEAVRNQQTYQRAIELGIISEDARAVDMQGMDLEALVRGYEARLESSRGVANNFAEANEEAAESVELLSPAMARAHAAGMNYIAGLELAGIATANMRAETESAAWNAEHFGGTLLSLPDSLHSTADEAWLAAGGIGGVASAADAAEAAVRGLEDALRGLSGEAIDFYSFSGNVSEAVGYAQRGARNQGSIDQYYGGGGGYDYNPGGAVAIPAPAAPSSPIGPGGGGPAPQMVVNVNTREAAAIALTMLGITRNAPLNSRMGLAR